MVIWCIMIYQILDDHANFQKRMIGGCLVACQGLLILKGLPKAMDDGLVFCDLRKGGLEQQS